LAFGCSCGEEDMTRDDIVSMVQEAIVAYPNPNPLDFRLNNLEQIEHFAELVAEFVLVDAFVREKDKQ
jgi:hypothetical protein